MQTPTDITLLQRWREQRDAGAFRTLTQRYGGMVYGICNRVLRNPADAEEVAQDCFLKLAQHPAAAERAVGPWLHSVAVRGSLDRVRSEQRRRIRELTYEKDGRDSGYDSAQDLLSQIDEAIHLLPPELRACVVTHFLEGRSQTEVAERLGISERTVRRRSVEAIERIRDFLAQRGVATSVAVLGASLGGLNAQALPVALGVSLGKLAIGGKACATAPTLSLNTYGTLGGFFAMKKAMGMGAGVILVALAAWWQFANWKPDTELGPVLTTTVASDSAVPEATVDTPLGTNNSALNEAATNATDPERMRALVSATAVETTKAVGSRLAPEPITDPAKYAAIAGIVVDERGRTIANARIDVLAIGTPSEGNPMHRSGTNPVEALWENEDFRFSTATDMNGAFSIEAIPFSGSAMIAAAADGFESTTTGGALTPESTTDVTITMHSGLALHGEVVTLGGLAVRGATVDAGSVFSGNGVRGGRGTPRFLQTRTDERGYFTLWLAGLSEDDEAVSTNLHIKSAEQGEGNFFPVEVGQEERIKLTLEAQWADLSGTILTGDREAAANHTIALSGLIKMTVNGSGMSDGAGYAYEATTDVNGRYTFEKLAAFADYTVTIFNPNGEEAAKTPLPKLETGNSNRWDYTLEDTIHITGEVRGKENDAPVPGVAVHYTSNNAGGADREVTDVVVTDANGAFEFLIVSGGGSYKFHPSYHHNGNVGPIPTDFSKTLELNAGDSTELILNLSAPWSRSFNVSDQFGQPVEGVQAGMQERMGGGMLGTNRPESTDADGFILFARLDPAMEVGFNFGKDGYIEARSEAITGQPGEALPVEPFILYRVADLTARLVDGAGAPIANTAVQCVATYGEGRSTTVQAATNGEGWLVLPGALPGTQVELSFTTESEAGASNLEAHIESAELTPDAENELGDVVLAPGV